MHAFRSLPLQIMIQEFRRRPQPIGAELWLFAVQEIFEQLSANVPVKKRVVELIFEAPQAPIARRVTILGAGLHQVKRSLKQLQAPAGELS